MISIVRLRHSSGEADLLHGTESLGKRLPPSGWYRVLGDRAFAVRVGKLLEDGNELRMERPNRRSLGDLAAEVSEATGIRVEGLRGRERTRAVSGARRLFVHKALIENELRAVDVAAYLGISPAAVTAHLRKLKSEERPL
jgi:hypothetical protein